MATAKTDHGILGTGAKYTPSLIILLCVGALTTLGILILFSATQFHSDDPYLYVKKQAIWLCIALIVGFLVTFIDLEKLRSLTWLIAGAGVLGLVLVLIPGIGLEINGARRWISLGPMNMQVSDFAKVAYIFTLAHYLQVNQRHIGEFLKGYVYPCMIIGVAFLLILLEPDYGTAALFGAVGFTMLFLAGVRMIYLVPTVIAGIGLFAVAVALNPVRMARITSFLDLEGTKADGGYQLWQGILAFGAGGISGTGLGNGRQQLSFLPEAHTDFIFAIMGEELGLIFTVGTVILFTIMFLTVLLSLRKAPNLFQFLLVMGALLMVVVQALINFGVVTGLLPTKGMSLPFISYGGSNLVVMFACIGILLNCFRTWNRKPLKRAREI